MKITDIDATSNRLKRRPIRHLDELRKGLNISFEYFSHKTDRSALSLKHTSQALDKFSPEFSSVTYGAGGTIETQSFDTIRMLQKSTTHPVAAHLTHIDTDKHELDALIERLAMIGIEHIVALRGDRNEQVGYADIKSYSSTVEMINGIKRLFDFDISVAGYPQTHPEAKSPHADIEYLKRKVDAGANRVLCQFCYDSNAFLRFQDSAIKAGITVPIIPGILPIHNFEQTHKFAEKCGASIPKSLNQLFSELPDNKEIFNTVSATVSAEYCTRLIDNGVTDFHFYTLNLATLVQDILYNLGVNESPAPNHRDQNLVSQKINLG